jgi:hypothetical protein
MKTFHIQKLGPLFNTHHAGRIPMRGPERASQNWATRSPIRSLSWPGRSRSLCPSVVSPCSAAHSTLELLSELVEMSCRLEPERGERSDVTSLLH